MLNKDRQYSNKYDVAIPSILVVSVIKIMTAFSIGAATFWTIFVKHTDGYHKTQPIMQR